VLASAIESQHLSGLTRDGQTFLDLSAAQERLLIDSLQASAPRLAEALRTATDGPPRVLIARGRSLALARPLVMGIVNLTSDSFSGDGLSADLEAALAQGVRFVDEGVDILDIGAESARADRPRVEAAAQAALLCPLVERLKHETGALISADTYLADVAEAVVEAGADIVNDISGMLLGDGAARSAARAGAAYVLNHTYEVPKVRPTALPSYKDVVAESYAFLAEGVERLKAAGLRRESILVDPGIAFGKSHDEDLEVLRRLGEYGSLGCVLMLAASRKNFIGSVLRAPPGRRLPGDAAVSALAVQAGVQVLRVHDVAFVRRVVDMAAAIAAGSPGDFAPDAGSWPWAAGADDIAHALTEPAGDASLPTGQRW
jgi:dihydropteroate synthase